MRVGGFGQPSLQLVTKGDVLEDGTDDGVILVSDLLLVAQVAPEEHSNDDHQHGDDADEQDDVSVVQDDEQLVHTLAISDAKICVFPLSCKRSDEFTAVFRRIHG